MDVEITGMPEPTISWFKDDRPIEQMMTTEYRLTQVGNCFKLIMENGLKEIFKKVKFKFFINFSSSAKVQDSGKYMVKAVNSGGEAQSIADFLVLEQQPDRMVEVTKTTVFSDLPQVKVSFPHFLITEHFLHIFFLSKNKNLFS